MGYIDEYEVELAKMKEKADRIHKELLNSFRTLRVDTGKELCSLRAQIAITEAFHLFILSKPDADHVKLVKDYLEGCPYEPS